jgi:hypothetical protein
MPHSQDSSLPSYYSYGAFLHVLVARLVIVDVDRPPQFHVVFQLDRRDETVLSHTHTLTLTLTLIPDIHALKIEGLFLD